VVNFIPHWARRLGAEAVVAKPDSPHGWDRFTLPTKIGRVLLAHY
jgi:hypothetical protein